MKIEILDTKTGKRKQIDTVFSPFWWAEGNGSCDCNRAIVMECVDEMDIEMRKQNPELKSWQSYCFGCHRFLITMCDDSTYTLLEYNNEYPDKLLKKYSIL